MRCIPITEILSQDQIVPAFLERTLGYIQISGLIRQSLLLEAFGDICSNRNCGSSHLRCQTINLVFWIRFTMSINRQNKFMRPLPYDQILKFLCRWPLHPVLCHLACLLCSLRFLLNSGSWLLFSVVVILTTGYWILDSLFCLLYFRFCSSCSILDSLFFGSSAFCLSSTGFWLLAPGFAFLLSSFLLTTGSWLLYSSSILSHIFPAPFQTALYFPRC
jgi:hypothetical protein